VKVDVSGKTSKVETAAVLRHKVTLASTPREAASFLVIQVLNVVAFA
jgi:hypothetical protein